MFAARNMMLASAVLGDAAAYVAAVTAVGATVSGAQSGAIDAFITAEKAAGRWAGMRRIYLPIWGVSAANAICLKSLTSGSFVGGVTHSTGYTQGNGSTGYFSLGISPTAAGLTNASMSFGALIYAADTRSAAQYVIAGSSNGGNNGELMIYRSNPPGNTVLCYASRNPAELFASIIPSPISGIIITLRESATSLKAIVRKTSGLTVSTEATGSAAANIVSSASMFAMGLNNGGALQLPTDAQMGAYYMGLGTTQANAEAFTSNLKTLWETCTGLILP